MSDAGVGRGEISPLAIWRGRGYGVGMITIAGHEFADTKLCIVCHHVLDGEPVLTFAHDDDGDLQFACGAEDHAMGDWSLVELADLDKEEFDLEGLPRVEKGHVVIRESEDEDWELVEYE
ncbi:hypothetical protein GTZ99_15170 [Novosphingobium sp. FSY-8]|uniref:Uncharacterized protein n=1 Tax=Novosphingobium ovatum TaxID=1908523 RepID=A0ABW9XH78_9SPHN|nr:hypothetical protein [Novosphingobium ovatum]NBC37895.1 hypothetical protein [Novosphingobium ovatum]